MTGISVNFPLVLMVVFGALVLVVGGAWVWALCRSEAESRWFLRMLPAIGMYTGFQQGAPFGVILVVGLVLFLLVEGLPWVYRRVKRPK